MRDYLTRRIVATIPLLFLISILCFALLHAVPGGPTATYAENPKVSPQDLARIRTNLGLDKPIWQQYGMWLNRVLRGDLGYSYVTGEPVARMIVSRLPATLELMAAASLIAVLVGIGLGALAALRPYTRRDAFLGIVALVALSIPVFWSGLMGIFFFSVKWRLLPAAGFGGAMSTATAGDHLRHLVLPSVVLAVAFAASWSRYARASMITVLGRSFIRVARAKGLSNQAVLRRHVVRNAAAPVLMVVALQVPALFTGAVITETVFAWPGMGRLFYDGLLRMDYSRVMGIVVVSSLLVVLFNLLADVLYGLLDPRVGRAESGAAAAAA